jgi:hypothetical protein
VDHKNEKKNKTKIFFIFIFLPSSSSSSSSSLFSSSSYGAVDGVPAVSGDPQAQARTPFGYRDTHTHA